MERLNGEIITGIALAFMAISFLYAGTVNTVWATIRPADFLILAIGAPFSTPECGPSRRIEASKTKHPHS